MTDTAHLHALELGLSHERGRMAAAKTDGERELRRVWVAQYEREVARERAFLGLPPEMIPPSMDDDEMLAALGVRL